LECPACGASLDNGLWRYSCPRCGYPIHRRERVRLAFHGDAIEVLGWVLLSIPSLILFFPFPFYLAAFCRWFARNLSFSDRASAEFRGSAGEIFGWALLALFGGGCAIGPRVGIGTHIRLVSIDLGWWTGYPFEHPWWFSYAVIGAIVLWLLGVLGELHVIRWCAAKTALTTREQFEFHGEYWELAAWQILNALAVLTIIGWAWTTAAAYRWAARNTRSADRSLAFHGDGFEILWRTILMCLCCLPIVTIPWALLWYTRWLVSQVSIGSPEVLD
jgi:hypothetical protein